MSQPAPSPLNYSSLNPLPDSSPQSGQGRLWLGCAVWAFRGWLGSFYPRGSRSGDFLRLYGERLTAVEGNTTFYSVPDEAMVQKWVKSVPDTFRFCPKLPREITHRDRLVLGGDAALDFLERMQGLGDRLGPIFAQLPPGYGPDLLEDLAEFLERWPIGTTPLALEVRHPAWFQAPHDRHLNRLLAQFRVGRVLLDTRAIYDGADDPQALSTRRKPNVPLQSTVTTTFALVRYISHPREERNHRYWDEWCDRILAWLAKGIDVYLFVHCPEEVNSPEFVRAIQQRLVEKGAVQPLPWDYIKEDIDEQLNFF
ncbi:MAG: DUF72 domain-containing protein [Cyanobacteria bacterium P01_E01_bin.34]